MLKPGTKAPSFSLTDQNGDTHILSQYAGKKVVLYFYPKDNTPGCSRQAAAFANVYEELKVLGVEVLGVSKDSVASHEKFASKYCLPFPILSDTALDTVKAYGVWQEKKLYGKVNMGVVRTTFLIGEDGTVEKVWEKAKPDTNPGEVLTYLRGE